MINTAEFWVGIAFLICGGIFYRLILPKLNATLTERQHEIERMFADAETLLASAERKFSCTQERYDALHALMAEMEHEFESKINHMLAEWGEQKDRITQRYRVLGHHQLEHLTDHMRRQLYDQVIQACLNVLQQYLSKHMTAKVHQQLVINSLQVLNGL